MNTQLSGKNLKAFEFPNDSFSNWVKYPVTVLVRDPDTFKAKYEVEVLRWLEDQGFINGFIRAFNLLQPARWKFNFWIC